MLLQKKIILLIIIAACCNKTKAQHSIPVSFLPVYGNGQLILDKPVYTNTAHTDSIIIQTLRFYISSVQLFNNDEKVWEEKNSYRLIDAESPQQMQVNLSIPSNINYNYIKFNVGIDSITNAAGAGAGVLDATKGMYWAWHSGYINFKLEGISPLCKTRKNNFQFHLGGFRDGQYCTQQIALPVANKNNIDITINIKSFIDEIDLKLVNTVMTPGVETVALSKKAATIFSIKH